MARQGILRNLRLVKHRNPRLFRLADEYRVATAVESHATNPLKRRQGTLNATLLQFQKALPLRQEPLSLPRERANLPGDDEVLSYLRRSPEQNSVQITDQAFDSRRLTAVGDVSVRPDQDQRRMAREAKFSTDPILDVPPGRNSGTLRRRPLSRIASIQKSVYRDDVRERSNRFAKRFEQG